MLLYHCWLARGPRSNGLPRPPSTIARCSSAWARSMGRPATVLASACDSQRGCRAERGKVGGLLRLCGGQGVQRAGLELPADERRPEDGTLLGCLVLHP